MREAKRRLAEGRASLREVGVHGNEPLAEWIYAQTKGLERLGSQEPGGLVRGKKRKNGALPVLQPNLDFGDIPYRALSRRKDHSLSVNRPIPKRGEQVSGQGKVRGFGIDKHGLGSGRSAVRRKHLDLDLKQAHDQLLFYSGE